MKIKLPLLALSILCFCTAHAQSLLNKIGKVDHVKVIFLKPQKVKSFIVHDKLQVKFFKELITKAKNDPALKCDTNTKIIYYQGNTPVFIAYYSIYGSVAFSMNNVNVISKVNYGAGRIMEEEYYLNK